MTSDQLSALVATYQPGEALRLKDGSTYRIIDIKRYTTEERLVFTVRGSTKDDTKQVTLNYGNQGGLATVELQRRALADAIGKIGWIKARA